MDLFQKKVKAIEDIMQMFNRVNFIIAQISYFTTICS